MQLTTACDPVLVMHDSRKVGVARMDLQSRLRREQDSGPSPDSNALMERVSGKHSWCRAHENEIKRAVHLQAAADPQRRLRIRLGDDGAPVPKLADQFKPRLPPDGGRGSLI
jgi:hypothetical protein